MTKIKLTYFDGRGRGELSRLILAYGGQPWEDDRISFEQWPELKPSKSSNFRVLEKLKYYLIL